MILYRQGDVLLIPTTKPRQKLSPVADNVIARGEATGHDHIVINGQVFVDEHGVMFVKGSDNAVLSHQDQSGAIAEHQPIAVPDQWYEVRIEEEYAPEGLRRVVD